MPEAPSQTFTVAQLAALVGGRVVGPPDAPITGVNRIDQAGGFDASFITSDAYVKFLPITKAGAVLINEGLVPEAGTFPPLIVVDDAYRSFVKVMQQFFPPLRMTPGLRHASAVIHPEAQVHETACIGPGCAVDEGCIVGERVMLYANVSLYAHVSVGADTVIHANVVCGAGTQIGERCIIHPGAVIGADGFGFFENPDGSFEKIPQVGIVELGNDVEVGANTTIDRAAVGRTLIGNGVKLDNLIHIAHGVSVGDHTAMAAQAGISGSAVLGKRNRIAGQVGVVGHISTADDVIVEAQSGLSKSVTVAGAYFGSPAKEHRTALRMEAALRQLPDLLREVREMGRVVAELKERIDE